MASCSGLDSFANLEAFLRGEGAIDAAFKARWDSLPATATRKLPPR
jgi:hypothetical protein